MHSKIAVKAIVFDFNRTLYDPDSDSLISSALKVLEAFSKDFPMALYCKKGEGREQRISELGMQRFFKKIVFVENKSPEDFRKIAEEFKVKTEEIVVIGDRIKSEIATSKNAGCKAIWFRKGKFAEEAPTSALEEPDFTIFQLEELFGKIEKKK